MKGIFKHYNHLSSRQLLVLGSLTFTALLTAVLGYNIFISSADYQATGRVYPNADVQTDFNDCMGAGCDNHWDVLDDVSYDFTNYVFDDTNQTGEIEEFEMTEAAGATKPVQEVEVNFRAYASGGCAGNCDQIQANIFIDGGYSGTPQTITLSNTDTLYSLTFNGSWTGDDDLRVQLTRVRQQSNDTVRLTRVFADIEYTQPNDPPNVSSVVVTPVPDGTDTINVTQGDVITFEINWSDPDGDSARAIICKTRSIVGGDNPGCPGDAWVGPSPLDTSGTITLNYTTNSNDALTPPPGNEYYIYVCDSPGGECSVNPPLLPSIGNNSSGYFMVDRITAELYDWAWSSNIGWISFNHVNCDNTPDPPDGQSDAPCPAGKAVADYNVSLDTATGHLSGYAWSERVGWISFNRTEAGNPPDVPFNTGNLADPIARLDGAALRGWARALAPCQTPPTDGTPPPDGILPCDANDDGTNSGWDGWIKLGD